MLESSLAPGVWRTSFRFRIACRIGNRYAAVFPDPVFALAAVVSQSMFLAATAIDTRGKEREKRKQ